MSIHTETETGPEFCVETIYRYAGDWIEYEDHQYILIGDAEKAKKAAVTWLWHAECGSGREIRIIAQKAYEI